MASYLTIPGIPGDSVARGHEGAIEIDTWSFGVTVASGSFGTGARAGRPQFNDLAVTCRAGSASPRLFEACATGRAIPDAVLVSEQAPDGTSTEVRLSDVGVSSHTVTGGPHAVLDEFRLSFVAVTFTVRVPRPDGRAGEPVTTTQPSRGSPVPSPASGGVWRSR